MKKTLLAATILAMTSATAFAADSYSVPTVSGDNKTGAGEVVFEGTVHAVSCKITVADQSNNATVRLPLIHTSEFTETANEVKHKKTPFSIVMSDCEGVKEDGTIGVSWTEADMDNPEKGYLKNRLTSADAAKNVSIVISKSDGASIIPGTHSLADGGSTDHYSNATNSATTTYKNGTATIDFTAAYVKTNVAEAVSAGKIETAAVYSVFYE